MNFICISRREKVVPQRKQRRVTMFSASLRSANKIINLILTLKSSLAVVDCWLASLPDQVNAAELMGELEDNIFFASILCLLVYLKLFPSKFQLQIHLGRKGTGVLYEEDSKEERQGQCWCRLIKCASWFLVLSYSSMGCHFLVMVIS